MAAQGEKGKKQNHFAIDYGFNAIVAAANGSKLTILKSPTGREIEAHYELGRELDHSEFGITYLCTNKELGISYGCR